MKAIQKALKLYPEIIAIPGILIIYVIVVFAMRHIDNTVPMIDLSKWLSFPFALLACFYANFAAYTAIKFNRPDLWKQYVEIIDGTCERDTSYLSMLWWRYYLSILCAVFLSLLIVI
jgi:hypothetical protein